MVGSSDGEREREMADALIKVYIHLVVKFPSHEEAYKKAEEMLFFVHG